MSSLVLKIAEPNTVTVPVTCQLFGDEDRVITTLKLKVTFEKTKPEAWKQQHEEASASLEPNALTRLLFSKIKTIKGLPLERDGQPVDYSDDAFDLIKDEVWIIDPLWLALGSINSGKRSDTLQRVIAKN